MSAPIFIRRNDSLIAALTGAGACRLSFSDWQVWETRGYTYATGMGNLTPTEFDSVIRVYGGWVEDRVRPVVDTDAIKQYVAQQVVAKLTGVNGHFIPDGDIDRIGDGVLDRMSLRLTQ